MLVIGVPADTVWLSVPAAEVRDQVAVLSRPPSVMVQEEPAPVSALRAAVAAEVYRELPPLNVTLLCLGVCAAQLISRAL